MAPLIPLVVIDDPYLTPTFSADSTLHEECALLVAHLVAAQAALRDRDAEIARHHRDFERWEEMANRAVMRAQAAEERLQAIQWRHGHADGSGLWHTDCF